MEDNEARLKESLLNYRRKVLVKEGMCIYLGFFSRILNDVVVGQEDLSMIFALASTWAMFHAFGSLACVGPISYTIGMAYQNAFDSGLSLGSQTSGLGFLALVNSLIFVGMCFVIGYPVASAFSPSSSYALIFKCVLQTISQMPPYFSSIGKSL